MASPAVSPHFVASVIPLPSLSFCTRAAAKALAAAFAAFKDLRSLLRCHFVHRFSSVRSPCSSHVSLSPACGPRCRRIAAFAFTCFCVVAGFLPGCQAQTRQQLEAMAAGTGYPAGSQCSTYLCAVLVTPVAEDWKKQQQLLKTVARGDGPRNASSFKAFMLRMLALSGNRRSDRPLRIGGLINYLEKNPGRFFTRVLPLLASAALHIKDLFPDGLRFLTAVTYPEIHLRKTQVFALLAGAFLGVLPHNQKALLLAAAPSLAKAASAAAASSSFHQKTSRSPSSSSSSSSTTSTSSSSPWLHASPFGLSLPAALATLSQGSADSLAAPSLITTPVDPAAASASAAYKAPPPLGPAAAAAAAVAAAGYDASAAAETASSRPPVSLSSSAVPGGPDKINLQLNKLDMHYRGFFERLPKYEALLLYFDAMERRLSRCWKEIVETRRFDGPPPCSAACPCFFPKAAAQAGASATAAAAAKKDTEREEKSSGSRRPEVLSSAVAAEAAAAENKGGEEGAAAAPTSVGEGDQGLAVGREGITKMKDEGKEEPDGSSMSFPLVKGSFSIVDPVIGFYRHSRARASFSQLSRRLGSFQTIQIDAETVASSQQYLTSLRVIPSGDITASDGALMVDFADKFLGGLSMFSGHIAQEEYLFIVFPELHVVMLFNDILGEDEAVVVKGVERFVFVSGYEKTFKIEQAATPAALPSPFCPGGGARGGSSSSSRHCHTQCALPFDTLGRSEASIVALDALDFSHINPARQFSVDLIHRELLKAAVGFKGDPYEPYVHNSPQPVASGWWGCTVFGGDAWLKTLLQWIAASLAGRRLRFYTFGSSRIPQLQKDVQALANKYKTVQNLYAGLMAVVKQQQTAGVVQQPPAFWESDTRKPPGQILWEALLHN